MTASPQSLARRDGFRHEALLYAGDDDFVARTAPFIRKGIEEGQPVLVVVGAYKIDMLRSELGSDAGDRVKFADMAEVGRNPALIIPAWRDFLVEHGDGGRPARGIGEPIWAERTADEVVESQRHEELLNVAFADAEAFGLLCPYDTETLGSDVIEEAYRSHPSVDERDGGRPSPHVRQRAAMEQPFDRPLAQPETEPEELSFDGGSLDAVRRFVAHRASEQGLAVSRMADFVLAVGEVATNSVRHGGGSGVLRLWRGAHSLICEVSDAGHITQPLAGRERPDLTQQNGFGLWLANHLCDLVQVRSFPSGSVIRLHMRI